MEGEWEKCLDRFISGDSMDERIPLSCALNRRTDIKPSLQWYPLSNGYQAYVRHIEGHRILWGAALDATHRRQPIIPAKSNAPHLLLRSFMPKSWKQILRHKDKTKVLAYHSKLQGFGVILLCSASYLKRLSFIGWGQCWCSHQYINRVVLNVISYSSSQMKTWFYSTAVSFPHLCLSVDWWNQVGWEVLKLYS